MFKSTVGALVFLLAAVSAGRFGCHNPHPYCKKDNHPKEACTDWGKDWKGWMEENCPEKCGKCGGGGGGPPPPPGRGRDGAAPPLSSLIKQAFYIFPPIPKGGGGAVAVGRGEYGCGNPHPYCKKDNHPKEACTDWGEGWKGWMEENCPEKCGKCGGGGGGPPPPPGPSAPGKGAPPPGPGPKPPGPKPPGPPGPGPDASCGDLKDDDGYPCAKYAHFCGIDSHNGKGIGQACPKTCCENKEDLSGCNKPADKQAWCKDYRGKVHCKENDYTKENCPTSCGCF